MAARWITLLGLLGRSLRLRLTSSAGARAGWITALGRARGLPQKIGQVMATARFAHADPGYLALTEHPGPLSEAAFRAALEEAWRQLPAGTPALGAVIRRIIYPGVGASLSQVHRAELQDGTEVALKLQYPGIHDTVRADLRLVSRLLSPLGGLSRGREGERQTSEIHRGLLAELDYRAEAAALARFAERWRGDPVLRCPTPLLAYSHTHLLVMTWADGSPPGAFGAWSGEERASVASALLRAFLSGVFRWGEFHADPHPGNLRLLRRPGKPPWVTWIDWGATHALTPDEQAGWTALVDAMLSGGGTPEAIEAAWVRVGFSRERLAPMRSCLPALTACLLRPFTVTGVFRTHTWSLASDLRAVLGPHRQAFRRAGPPRLLAVIRAFQGLLRYLDALDVPLDWRAHLAEARGGRPAAPVQPDTLPAWVAPDARLHIHLEKAGVTRVALTFPLATLPDLPDLLPPEVHERLQERGVDLARVLKQTQAAGCPRGPVVRLTDTAKGLRVWID